MEILSVKVQNPFDYTGQTVPPQTMLKFNIKHDMGVFDVYTMEWSDITVFQVRHEDSRFLHEMKFNNLLLNKIGLTKAFGYVFENFEAKLAIDELERFK